MRPLAIILLLLLAVACDANNNGVAEDVREPDPTASVASPPDVDDDRSEPTVAATGASATVTAWAETDDRVVDGFCPADPDKYVFRSTKVQARPASDWELSGIAKQGHIELEWGEPPVSGVTGYVVTRHSRAPDLSRAHSWAQVEGSMRTFAVNAGSREGEWADTDIEPCTTYRYRVFPVTADGLGFPVGALDVSSLPPELPDGSAVVSRLGNFEVLPTRNGVTLTWELPADPAREGILVRTSTKDDDEIQHTTHMAVLPSDITAYTVLTRGYDPRPHVRYCYSVGAFNDFWAPTMEHRMSCVSSSEMVHCLETTEEVSQGVGPRVTIRFRGCKKASTEVVRHELTVDGFKDSKIEQPCGWFPSDPAIHDGFDNDDGGFDYNEGILICEYVDTDVKPGTWYVYELTQTLKDGRTFTSHHEVVTHPSAEVP